MRRSFFLLGVGVRVEVSGKALLRILVFELDLEKKWDTDAQKC